MKWTVKRGLATLLMVACLTSVSTISASAATRGGEDSKAILVTTQADWSYPGSESITLKQNKNTLTYKSLFSSKTKTKTAYGYYNITVTPIDGGKSFTKEWDGTSSIKIKLERDKSYWIDVAYDWQETWLSNELGKAPTGYSFSKDNGYSWWVGSTHKASAM